MDLILLGEFETKTGKLYAGDPCYTKKKDLVKLSVKPGRYEVYLIRGKLNSYESGYPEDFHNSEIFIRHVCKRLKSSEFF